MPHSPWPCINTPGNSHSCKNKVARAQADVKTPTFKVTSQRLLWAKKQPVFLRARAPSVCVLCCRPARYVLMYVIIFKSCIQRARAGQQSACARRRPSRCPPAASCSSPFEHHLVNLRASRTHSSGVHPVLSQFKAARGFPCRGFRENT